MKKKQTSAEPEPRISEFSRNLNPVLFSHLDSVTGNFMNAEHCRIALLFEKIQLEAHVKESGLPGGRPFFSLKPTARAFLAKSALNIPTTKDLVARLRVDHSLKILCGFVDRVPSEATFSRHFQRLSDSKVLDKVHEILVRTHLGQEVVYHVSRDSSEIRGREKRVRQPKAPRPPRKDPRGRKRGTGDYKAPSRLPRQFEQKGYEDALKELPTNCDLGTKTSSKGYLIRWNGYKLHLDVSDNGFPLSAFTSAANLNDSQVAIPLSRMTAARVGTVLYELMDKGYDAGLIRKAVLKQGHVPLIQRAKHGKREPIPFNAAEAMRFKIRTTVERSFSEIKESLGGRFVRVRGAVKVHMHLMCSVLNLFALSLIRYPIVSS